MKVILLQDIKTLGKKGDVKEVADGYARNSLIPKKLVAEATAANMNMLAHEEKRRKEKNAKELTAAEELGEKLNGMELVIETKCGEGGRLFGSVTNADIAGALADKGFEVDKRKIEISDPIKQIGRYEVSIRLHPQVQVKFSVSVIAIS